MGDKFSPSFMGTGWDPLQAKPTLTKIASQTSRLRTIFRGFRSWYFILCYQMINLCMNYSGASGDCNSAPVRSRWWETVFCFWDTWWYQITDFFWAVAFTIWVTDLIGCFDKPWFICVQFLHALWLLEENIHCCLLPVEKYLLLMVKKMFVVHVPTFFLWLLIYS